MSRPDFALSRDDLPGPAPIVHTREIRCAGRLDVDVDGDVPTVVCAGRVVTSDLSADGVARSRWHRLVLRLPEADRRLLRALAGHRAVVTVSASVDGTALGAVVVEVPGGRIRLA